jgi:hypothetical protein
MTRNLNAGGKQITVNVSTIKEGTLTAELVKNGKPIRGFSRADCKPIRGDHHAKLLQWKGGTHCPAENVQIRFYLQRAKFYGFDL